MDSELVKYAKALLGLVIFIVAIIALEFSNVVQLFARQPIVESGKVAVGGTDAFITIVQTVISALFTYAVWFFSKVGDSGIAAWKAFFGFKSSVASAVSNSAPAAKTSGNPIELDQLIADLTAKARATRNSKLAQADAEARAEIEVSIRKAMESISNA